MNIFKLQTFLLFFYTVLLCFTLHFISTFSNSQVFHYIQNLEQLAYDLLAISAFLSLSFGFIIMKRSCFYSLILHYVVHIKFLHLNLILLLSLHFIFYPLWLSITILLSIWLLWDTAILPTNCIVDQFSKNWKHQAFDLHDMHSL